MKISAPRVTACAIATMLAWAAAAGTPDDDFRRGLSAFNIGDYPTALRLWRPLAEREEPRSQAGIGFMYHRGLGVGVDDREAAVWLRRAAEHGQAEGQLMLGILFYYGQGVPQSFIGPTPGANWRRAAAMRTQRYAATRLSNRCLRTRSARRRSASWSSCASATGRSDNAGRCRIPAVCHPPRILSRRIAASD